MTAYATPVGTSDRSSRWDPGFLATLMRSDRLTLVFSPAGADRDAMVQRTLMPMFGRRAIDRSMADAPPPAGAKPATERRHRRRDSQRGAEVVIRFDGWGARPLQALREQIAAVLPPPAGEVLPSALGALLNATARAHDARLLLVFDGFERHLATSPADFAEVLQFDHQLVEWLRQPESSARVLFLVDDASQPLLLQRYGSSMQQFGRGWLRIRPPAQPAARQAIRSPISPLGGPATHPATTQTTTQASEQLPAHAAKPAMAPAPVQEPVAATPAEAAPPDDATDEISSFVRGLDLGPTAEPELRFDVTDDAFVAQRDVPRHAPAAEPGRWWSTFFGAALGVLMGLAIGAAAWFFWLRGEAPPAVASGAAVTAQPGPAAPPAPAPPPGPVAQNAPPRPAAPPAAAALPPVVPQQLTLAIAVPPDSGSAQALLDELARQVGAPSGLTVNAAPSVGPAGVALLRADALPVARDAAAAGAPRALIPLFREQIQVLARADGRWRFLHQLKGAHLNVGEAGGARSQTANALYRRLFGGNLPSWDVDRRDEASAVRELLREGSALDAVFVVSDRPALEQLPASVRSQLRVLALDPQHPSTAEVMRSFAVPAESAGRAPLPQVTSYLVADAAGASPALQALACALVRSQPELQQRGSALLRGIDGRTPAPAGWVSLLASGNGGCPPR